MTAQAFDLIVIGEGIAGLTAANNAAKAGVRTASFEPELFGGLVISVNELDPSPDERTVSGAELAGELAMENMELGVTSVREQVMTVRKGDGERFTVVTPDNMYGARQVIIASGAKLRTLDVPGEAEFGGRGVSKCADCDGPLFRDARVVVVGGGDSALQEALILTSYGAKVHVVHRGERFSAHPRLVARVAADPRIEVISHSVIERIEGNDGVERVHVRSTTHGSPRTIPCAGVFPFVGLVPNASFAPAEVARDEAGYLRTAQTCESAVSGLWAIGAVRHGYQGTLNAAMMEARASAAGVAARLC